MAMPDPMRVAMLSCFVLHIASAAFVEVFPEGDFALEGDQSVLIQTRLNAETADGSEASDVVGLPSIYKPVQKAKTNDFARFVFFAGLGGTGHHGWHETMEKSGACVTHPAAESRMRKLWYGEDGSVDLFYDELVRELRDTTQHHIKTGTKQLYCLNIIKGSMLSYPDCNSKRHHPDLVSLASAAADAGADLRVIVMHRDPAPMLVSLSLHRGLLPLAEEANQMGNQAAILHAQLSSIDPQLFICVPFTGIVERAEDISNFVVGNGMEKSFSEAIRTHYISKADDVAGARARILKHEKHIFHKLKTWEAFHGLLLKGCVGRTPTLAA